MTNLPQYSTLSLTVGRDHAGLAGRYEYLLTTDDGEVILRREGGFKSAAAARRAGKSAAEPLLAPALF